VYEGRTPGSTPAPTPGTVLDEPTLGLDVNEAAVREFLREYNQRYGATVL